MPKQQLLQDRISRALHFKFPADIPRNEFQENSLASICQQIVNVVNDTIPNEHAIRQTAALIIFIETLRELLKNMLDAKAETFSIQIEYRPKKTNIIITDDGVGFGAYNATKIFYYSFEIALVTQSPKFGQENMFGGANLGLAMISHFLSKYGNGSLMFTNKTNEGHKPGALLSLSSDSKPCKQQAKMHQNLLDWSAYHDEMLLDLMSSILKICSSLDKIKQNKSTQYYISLPEFKIIRENILKELLNTPNFNPFIAIALAIQNLPSSKQQQPASSPAFFAARRLIAGIALPGRPRPSRIYHPAEQIPDEDRWPSNHPNWQNSLVSAGDDVERRIK